MSRYITSSEVFEVRLSHKRTTTTRTNEPKTEPNVMGSALISSLFTHTASSLSATVAFVPPGIVSRPGGHPRQPSSFSTPDPALHLPRGQRSQSRMEASPAALAPCFAGGQSSQVLFSLDAARPTGQVAQDTEPATANSPAEQGRHAATSFSTRSRYSPAGHAELRGVRRGRWWRGQ